MSNLNSMDKRMIRALMIIDHHMHPPVKETRLPYLVMDFDTGEDMPGFDAHNEEHRHIAQRLRCSPKIYYGDPNDDGCEA